jgi:hypothetical protein
MANKTGWAAGRLFTDLAWHAGFGSELATLASTATVLSSVILNNDTGLDQLVDLGFVGTIASATIAPGAGVNVWAAYLAPDGTTYGDGRITSTPQTTYQPPWWQIGFIPIGAGATITTLAGVAPGIALSPGKFKLVAQNLVGFNFLTGQLSLRSYNQDVNAA